MAITLTDDEMKLVTDAELLLVKNRIIQKVNGLFGRIAGTYKNTVINSGFDMAHLTEAKISKGENYKGLPYLVLDYPRRFAKEDVFAIRSFFWWGNFFSITMQLGGQSQVRHTPSIQRAIDENLLEDWFIGCSETPWQHHFEIDNYQSVKQAKTFPLSKLPHVKVAKKIPLTKWDDAEMFFEENFTFLIQVLNF